MSQPRHLSDGFQRTPPWLGSFALFFSTQVINGLMDREDWEQAIQTPLGILPGGSGNALAASVHHYSQWVRLLMSYLNARINREKENIPPLKKRDLSPFPVITLKSLESPGGEGVEGSPRSSQAADNSEGWCHFSSAIVPPQVLENLLVLNLREKAGTHVQTVVVAGFQRLKSLPNEPVCLLCRT